MDEDLVYRRYRELQDYVGWTDDDAVRVDQAGALIEPHLSELIDDFYAEIERHPQAKTIFANEAQVTRLKASLRKWLHQLFQGPYGAEYAVQRWHVGRRHVEVGLDHLLRHGVLARFLAEVLSDHSAAEWPTDARGLDKTVDSLNTLIDLDMAKIEDAYASEYLDRLQKSERLAAIGQIAGGVAHELRNPLNVVKTSAYYLLNAKSCSPDRMSEHLHRISRQVNHANDVITALSSFAKPPAPQLSSVSVRDCLHSTLERYPVPGVVRFVPEIPDSLPSVRADATQLGIVFGNLIRNAVDAMPGGGTLAVTAALNGSTVELRFADTGIGIERDNLNKIKEPLYSTKAKGMGLGLAITNAILAKISGSLDVDSEVGRGSTFMVRLQSAEGE